MRVPPRAAVALQQVQPRWLAVACILFSPARLEVPICMTIIPETRWFLVLADMTPAIKSTFGYSELIGLCFRVARLLRKTQASIGLRAGDSILENPTARQASRESAKALNVSYIPSPAGWRITREDTVAAR
jgi:hypothetical protein